MMDEVLKVEDGEGEEDTPPTKPQTKRKRNRGKNTPKSAIFVDDDADDDDHDDNVAPNATQRAKPKPKPATGVRPSAYERERDVNVQQIAVDMAEKLGEFAASSVFGTGSRANEQQEKKKRAPRRKSAGSGADKENAPTRTCVHPITRPDLNPDASVPSACAHR